MNLIVVCVDTWRWDYLGCYGNPWIQTPNIDRFAEDAILFEEAYGEGEPTIPTRRSLMTGIRSFPFRDEARRPGVPVGLPGWYAIPDEFQTIAERLREHGYTTGLVSDLWHEFDPTMNFTRGFHSFEWIRGQEGDRFRSGPKSRLDLTPYIKEGSDGAGDTILKQHLLNRQDWKEEADWFPAQVFQTAGRWLDDNVENSPFLLWVDCFDPHEPWDPPKAYADLYCPDYSGPDLIHPRNGPVDWLTPEELERIKALYAGEITLVDRWFSDFLDKIDELKLRDNTAVLFLADHGTALAEHGRLKKAEELLYRYDIGTPLILRLPGDAHKGKRIDAFVQSHDVTPTLLDLSGAGAKGLDGKSVIPLITEGGRKLRDYVIVGWGSFACVRDKSWSYMVAWQESTRDLGTRLYDLKSDPEEQTNVVDQHLEIADLMQARLDDLMSEGPR